MLVRQNWFELMSIQTGCVICVPMIMIGYSLGVNYGLFQALQAIFMGNLVLLPFGLTAVFMSIQFRESTSEIAARFLGSTGAKFLACTMMQALVGWFALQLVMVVQSVQELFLCLGYPLICSTTFLLVMCGAFMIFSTLGGITALNTLADISLPILCFTLGYAVYSLIHNTSVTLPLSSVTNTGFAGVSLVVASAIAAMVDAPTFYRFSRTKTDGFISMILICLLVNPAVLSVGAFLASYGAPESLGQALSAGGSVIWKAFVALFLIVAGWTTNNGNLYSAVVNSAPIFPVSERLRTCILGGSGLFLACLGIMDYFVTALEVMGMVVIVMGVAMSMLFIATGGRTPGTFLQKGALVSIVCGIVIGGLNFMGTTIATGLPVVDAALTTALLLATMISARIICYKGKA